MGLRGVTADARRGAGQNGDYGGEAEAHHFAGDDTVVRRIRNADGSEFIGETVHGQWHGQGCIMYHQKDAQGRVEYAGLFRGGQRHGYGSMLWKDGTNYMGEWKRNRPSGFGFEAYPNGSYYQGTFENDQRDGIGVYEFPDGLYYSGGWRHGKRYGSGIATGTPQKQSKKAAFGRPGLKLRGGGGP